MELLIGLATFVAVLLVMRGPRSPTRYLALAVALLMLTILFTTRPPHRRYGR